jgi:hypothetical protein
MLYVFIYWIGLSWSHCPINVDVLEIVVHVIRVHSSQVYAKKEGNLFSMAYDNVVADLFPMVVFLEIIT